MLSVIVNTVACLIGSLAGLLFRKGIPEKFRDSIMLAIGICTLYIGIQGSLKSDNSLVAILAMVGGVAIGTALDLDGIVNGMAHWVEVKYENKAGKDNTGNFTQGLVTAFLLWCVGAMTIIGSLEAGLGDNSTIYTKSVLDLISSCMLASSLGVGVIFACIPLFLFQGSLVLLSGLIQPLILPMVNEIICVGSLMIIALGLNLIGITKIKVVNFLPGILLTPLACILVGMLPL